MKGQLRICIEHHCAAPSHLILFVLCEGTVIPAFEMQELRLQEAKEICIQVDIISKWRSHSIGVICLISKLFPPNPATQN